MLCTRQVLVDTNTPASVATSLKAVLDPWFEARATELKPDPTVLFYGPSTDPMKISIAVYFSFAFNGEVACSLSSNPISCAVRVAR